MKDVTLSIRRVDGGTLEIPYAVKMAQLFFRLDPSAVGPNAYDEAVRNASREVIEEEDIHAINRTMAARSSLLAWAELIGRRIPWLDALDPEWELLKMTDDEWTAWDVEGRLVEAFASAFGRGRRLSVVTKVFHMKRPDLIPVCDRLVLEQLGAKPGTNDDPRRAAVLIGHIRREGRRQADALKVVQRGLELDGPCPSLLRIFEALVWQSHPETWYQRMVPLISAWMEEPPRTHDYVG